MSWQYKVEVVEFPGHIYAQAMGGFLNEQSVAGWELVSSYIIVQAASQIAAAAIRQQCMTVMNFRRPAESPDAEPVDSEPAKPPGEPVAPLLTQRRARA